MIGSYNWTIMPLWIDFCHKIGIWIINAFNWIVKVVKGIYVSIFPLIKNFIPFLQLLDYLDFYLDDILMPIVCISSWYLDLWTPLGYREARINFDRIVYKNIYWKVFINIYQSFKKDLTIIGEHLQDHLHRQYFYVDFLCHHQDCHLNLL